MALAWAKRIIVAEEQSKADPQGEPDKRNKAEWMLIAAVTLSDLAAARAFWGSVASEHDYGILLNQDGWTWDKKKQIYRSRSGHKLTGAEMRTVAVHISNDGARRLRKMADDMSVGAIPLAEWQRATAEEVKRIYLTQAALAVGGFDNLQANPEFLNAATGAVEKPPGINFSISRLYDFAHDVHDAAPRNDTTAAIVNRAGAYADASLSVYEEVRRESHKEVKDEGRPAYLWERNILGEGIENHCHNAEHTEGCVELTAKGWVPIGSLPPIGTRTCANGCGCEISYSLLGPAEEK